MTRKIITILILTAFTFGCSITNKTNNTKILNNNKELTQKFKKLVCSNGYTLQYKNIEPNSIYIEVIKENKIKKHTMKISPSGSGAKYQTDDGQFIFWSHHGDFTYFENDKKICSYIAPIKKATTNNGFLYTITFQTGKTLEIEVDNSKSASINKVYISSNDFKETVAIEMETDPITNIFVNDLDHNGFEELYLVTTCAGSGSYGDIHIFISDKDQKIIQTSLPEISETELKRGAIFEGYMGHDTFYIKKSQIVREFPVYKEKDINSNPTGGKKKVSYILKDNKFKML